VSVVLIVEDEESYRDALGFMLEREGFEVIMAADGAEGLAQFERHGADIVLLDLMMPGLSGTEVCRRLRQRAPSRSSWSRRGTPRSTRSWVSSWAPTTT
jgi:two-component system response regulator RegX3